MDTRLQKFNDAIAKGRTRVPTILGEMQQEFENRRDMLVKPEGILYVPNGEGFKVKLMGGDGNFEEQPYNFTSHARSQILSRVGVPVKYADKLVELGEQDLLLDNLNTMTKRLAGDGLMVRHIADKIKGVLSPAYRRMDACPIFEGFIKACLENGYVPYNGKVTDYRYHISFVIPEVFSPKEGEYIVVGISITTSDYGGNALMLELTILRISCLNLMVGTDVMRQIHIGKRFSTEDVVFELSKETHDLDSKAIASAVGDAVKGSIALQGGVRARIEGAIGAEVNIKEEIAKMRKRGFKKELAEQVKTMYETPMPIELLPQDEGKWRLSNAISLLANGQEGDSQLDLQKYANEVL